MANTKRKIEKMEKMSWELIAASGIFLISILFYDGDIYLQQGEIFIKLTHTAELFYFDTEYSFILFYPPSRKNS